ncbi:RagB/SusD family nutrient uptake outer membrane protein [Pedobacter caeni]|uniref:SusD family protein n=1 Tax=Pedobacter caeni TaxID=288992 RepID=A0A1M5G1M8_9SPHI|nr:RagB/SusD family nutrient uptake outer membrane protein [Pedobacter caeni]SHF97619.1 SusD family protein [Pedobacter caeni]
MKRIHILILFAFLTVFSACKRFLDIKPNGKTIPKTGEEFAALLHSRLNDLDYGSGSGLIGNVSTVSALEYYSDNLDANLTQYPGGSSIPVYIGAHLNSKQTRYSELYAIIRDCNIIIDNLKSKGTPADNDVMGTAYAIRGFSYYSLLREFCEPFRGDQQVGLALVTEFNMEEKPLRSTYGQTVALIEDDLNKSISYNVKDKLFRFTADVARAYLARLHFWTRNWDKTIVHAAALLQAHPMLDTAAYHKMIQSKNAQQGNTLLRSYIFSDVSSDLAYKSEMGTLKSRPASKEFFDLFTEKENDIRFQLSFGPKRVNEKNFFANVRTDEMCLMLAEAYAHKGDESNALNYLNQIRSKRIAKYQPYTMVNLPEVKAGTISQDANGKPLSPLIQAILNERRKELYGEGDRWFELKRNGCPSFWVAANGRKYTTLPYMYTFPISGVDVQIINGLEQNPGY